MSVIRKPLIATLTSACLVACDIEGSANIARETRSVSGIRAVELVGSAELSIVQTGIESLTVATDDNLLDHISSDVVDGTLMLEVDGFIDPSDGIVYELSVANLEHIKLSGSGSVDLTGFDGDRLTVSIGGSGTVTASGSTTTQELILGGSGRYEASDLDSATATLDIGGSGSANVFVRDRLDITLAGSGTVTYRGEPTVSQQVNGSGSVSQTDQ